MSELGRWYDRRVVGSETGSAIETSERIRLEELGHMAALASTIPRRLGSDATRQELAADKRLSRQIAHAANAAAKLWQPLHPLVIIQDDERGWLAAQVVWAKWWEQHSGWLNNRRSYIAAWAVANGHRRLGTRYIERLSKEQDELQRIMTAPRLR